MCCGVVGRWNKQHCRMIHTYVYVRIYICNTTMSAVRYIHTGYVYKYVCTHIYSTHSYSIRIRLKCTNIVDTCTCACTFNSALYDEYMRIYACITYICTYILAWNSIKLIHD